MFDLGVSQDFSYANAGDCQLDYFHRRTTTDDLYFVVNRRAEPCRTTVTFRTHDRQPELWNPVYGTIEHVRDFEQKQQETSFDLELPANGSVFVVFRDRNTPQASEAYTGNSIAIGTGATRELRGPWNVHFDPAWGGPAEVTFPALTDWSTSDDKQIRYYSGTAAYKKAFHFQGDVRPGEAVWLDLGEVKNLARVYLNGKDLGVAWTSPYRVDLTPALIAGENQLRIEVVNLWPNRLIGDAALPESKRRTKTNITKFTSDATLLPSGLLGPVQLITPSRPMNTSTVDASPEENSGQ